MHNFRISKYDPARRNRDGLYLVGDWTCASDIGKRFHGAQLTAADYLRTEAAHVAAALRFFDASGLPHLRVTCLEDRFAGQNLAQLKADQPDLCDPAFAALDLHEDQKAGRREIEQICRMVLRNLIWCKLEVAGRFFIQNPRPPLRIAVAHTPQAEP